MTAPVLDCSVAAAWVLADEHSGPADAALDAVVAHGAVAPALLWFEIRNVLLRAERLGRIEPADSELALSLFEDLRLRLDHAPHGEEVMRLARAHGLSAYDAGYLELALRGRHPLATLDRKLARAAEAEGVDTVGR
ncbi:MAG: type II toxin-antitoxin system VapC family toxin [Gemmatimonadetes bacterium]|nr:type II toxin-antitoxin system VapC family toxin [Gemmatimonadota bacterium]MCY3943336.1 type II toxin-antitoxin system VapC family toxin [Gemmatimonadota bacterium]